MKFCLGAINGENGCTVMQLQAGYNNSLPISYEKVQMDLISSTLPIAMFDLK